MTTLGDPVAGHSERLGESDFRPEKWTGGGRCVFRLAAFFHSVSLPCDRFGQMKIVRIDHIALCVPELDPALSEWQTVLPLLLGPREFVPSQRTEAAFLLTLTGAESQACVELIAPKPRGENPGLEKFLQKRGGLHHIAFAVEDLENALVELADRGVPLIDNTPRPGARGHRVAFLHPKALGGVLVELVEAV